MACWGRACRRAWLPAKVARAVLAETLAAMANAEGAFEFSAAVPARH